MLLPNQPDDIAYWLLAFWLFGFGGAIGSFLNVVVYRLPAGLSLVKPASHCPACKHPIRWFDNIPMLGWLHLRGRCRDCGAAISPRYPAVEAISAALFLALGTVELLGGGVNLPSQAVALPGWETGFESNLPQQCGTCVYHLVLLSTLLAALLIELDGRRMPPSLYAPALAVGAVLPLLCSGLRPVSAFQSQIGWSSGMIDGGLGAAAGAILGLAAWRILLPVKRELARVSHRSGAVTDNVPLLRRSSAGANSSERHCFCEAVAHRGEIRGLAPVLGPICVGLFLGWQAAVVLTLVTAAIYGVLLIVGRWLPAVKRFGPTGWLALGTLAWILAWRSLVERFPGLG